MKNFGSVISPISNLISALALIPLAIVIFGPSLIELVTLYSIEALLFFIFKYADSRFFLALYPEARLYYPELNLEAIEQLNRPQQDQLLLSLLAYPKRRTIEAVLIAIPKAALPILYVLFFWSYDLSMAQALAYIMGICGLSFSFLGAAVFFESHREISRAIATLHERFNFSASFKSLNHSQKINDLGRYEIASLIAIWLCMLILLVLTIVFQSGKSQSLIGDVVMVALCGLVMASRIWYLSRNNFIEPLKKIFERFETFDPRRPSGELPLDSNPTLARFASVVNSLSTRISSYESELAHAVFRETEKSRYRALGQLSALIAHDLSAPLHVLQFCSQVIADDPAAARDDRYVSQLTGNSRRAVDLIESLKAYLKNPDGNEAVASFWKNHSNVLRILQLQYEKSAFVKVAFEAEGQRDELNLAISRQDLIHVLMNLYRNALDNMLQTSSPRALLRVSVQSRPEKGFATIRIHDNGTGLSAQRFEEMTSHESIPFVGRAKADGLGLRLVRRLVEQHGGTLDLDSTVKTGTCLVLRLKIAATQSEKLVSRAVEHVE